MQVMATNMRQQVFPSSDTGRFQHMADVGFGIVLLRGRPSFDDVSYRIGLALHEEAVEVRLQDFPCRPIAVGHGLELHKTLVGLLFRCTLPAVGGAADI